MEQQLTSPSTADATLPSTSSSTPATKSFDEKGRQWAWDSTSLKAADECLRKYQYKHILGWQKYGELSVHLRFGAIYASALELYAKARALGSDREEAILDVVQYALIESWDFLYSDPNHIGDDAFRIADSGKPWDSGHSAKTRSTLIRTIIWYFEHFAEDLPVIMLADGRPAVEHSFTLPFYDDIVYCGHIDKLVEMGGEPLVVDQKTTTATVSQYYFDQYSPDTQMSGYSWAGQIIYNMPIRGVMIDAAQITAGWTRFERGFAFRTPSQLMEWKDNSVATIERARKAVEDNYFPMNTTACGNYGGCEFRKICSRAPEVRDQLLRSDYQQGARWDPIIRR